jgi:hypothetical protein
VSPAAARAPRPTSRAGAHHERGPRPHPGRHVVEALGSAGMSTPGWPAPPAPSRRAAG